MRWLIDESSNGKFFYGVDSQELMEKRVGGKLRTAATAAVANQIRCRSIEISHNLSLTPSLEHPNSLLGEARAGLDAGPNLPES